MDRETFKQLFDQYFDPLRNYLFYRCGEPELATDTAQETFMRIWEKQLRPGKGKEKALLFKIGGDIFVTGYRKKQTALKSTLNTQENTSANFTEQDVEYRELKNKYEKMLTVMNEKHRVVFLMGRFDGMTHKEIAGFLNLSVKAVEKRMQQALDYLNSI